MTKHFDSHISKKLNQQLDSLAGNLMAMGGEVENQLNDALDAYKNLDAKLAQKIREKEKHINQMEVTLSEACADVLALQQPTAIDLRLVMAVFRANTDLERIGDEAKKIAKLTLKLMDKPPLVAGQNEILTIGNMVQKMLREALDAFARFDPQAALLTCQQDDQVDILYKKTLVDIQIAMENSNQAISSGLDSLWILRALERIGDHARNIAEEVIYMIQGQDIRHQKNLS
jgi:phosphate transport system protein